VVYLFGFVCLGVCLALVASGKFWFDRAEEMFNISKEMWDHTSAITRYNQRLHLSFLKMNGVIVETEEQSE